MFIAPLLLVLAVILAVGLTVAAVTSLILGAVLANGKTPSPLVVLFLFAIPSAAVGAALGAVAGGYFAVQADDEYGLFWGPMLGLIGGTVLGGGMGALVGVAWSRRRHRLPAGVSGA